MTPHDIVPMEEAAIRILVEETIVMFEEVVLIKHDHRRKGEKAESPEEANWLPPPPRHWLNPIHA
jgi:hypothetical protein